MKITKIFALFSLTPMIGISIITSCGNNGHNDPIHSDVIQVKNFSELKSTIEYKALQGIYSSQTIEITQDIVCDEPIYVMNDTTIITKENHSITRSTTFLDDLFVVGEDKDGNNPILSGEKAKLTFKTENESILTIDGNKDNIADEIYGSAIFVSNHSEVNLNENIVIQNFRKDLNKRSLTKLISKPINAGGAAVIVTSGTFNMYGGLIDNCLCPAADKTEDKPYMGGAIYNEAGFNMYGGNITNCSAARGGALYEYSYCNLVAGTISNCSATKYGGAIYLPDSQYVNLILGSESGTNKMIFKENSSTASGGAIFGQHQSVIYSLGNCIFDGNTTPNNGGAINSSGSILLDNTEFKNNKATGDSSKGGAIYSYSNSSTLTIRELQANGCTFESNSSGKSGGAIGFGVDDETLPAGSIGVISNSIFSQNTSDNGGAIWAWANSTVTLTGNEFNENSSTIKGGAIYNTGSTINLSKSDKTNMFYKNTAQDKGGAISVHTGGKLNIEQATFDQNSSSDNGGALFLYGGSAYIASTSLDDVIFTNNKTINADTYGGAIYISATDSYSAELKGSYLTVESNSATKYGGGIYLNTADSTKTNIATLDVNEIVINNNTSSGNGAGVYAAGKANIHFGKLTMNQNISSAAGGGMYLTGASQVTLDDVDANKNSGTQGGFVYITTTDTQLIIKKGSALENVSTSGTGNGSTLWCNTKKAIVKIKGKVSKEYFNFDGDISGADGFEVQDYEE